MVVLLAMAAGLLVAGIVKGGIGLGQNVVAVPLIATEIGLKRAVPLLVLTNLFTNAGQMWSARQGIAITRIRELLPMVVGGLVGIAAGTMMFAVVPERPLSQALAIIILLYVTVKAFNPGFGLRPRLAAVVAVPTALLVGAMQGATGVAGPLLASYLSAAGFRGEAFVFAIAAVFEALTCFQVISLLALGRYDTTTALLGLASLVPLLAGLALGSWARRYLSTSRFEKLVLMGLLLLAAQILYSTVH